MLEIPAEIKKIVNKPIFKLFFCFNSYEIEVKLVCSMVMSDELAARNPPLENTLSEKMESCIVTELVSAFKNTTLEKSDDPLTLCPEISREIQSRKLVIA